MIDIPTRVQIGPFSFSVRTVNPEEFQDADQFGNVTYKDQTIRLREGLHADATRETLIHEMIHAFYRSQGKRQSDEEEEIVSMLAPALLDTLRRNPALVAYLTAEDA